MAVSPSSRVQQNKPKGASPEIYFARNLAASDKKVRDRTIKKLKKWMSARSSIKGGLKEDELLKLWKGLFYCMWMSDKPLVQEELAETISSLIHVLRNRDIGLLFFKVSLVTMAREWHGIDKWRVEKFLMLVRRLIRHSLTYIAEGGWKQKETESLTKALSEKIINANKNIVDQQVPLGLQLHIVDLFLEELAKIGGEDLESSTILELLSPFIECLATTTDGRVKDSLRKRIFYHLMRQSDLGLAYENGGGNSADEEEAEEVGDEEEEQDENGIDAEIEEIEDPGDEDLDFDGDVSSEKDPRAGGVNAVLPQLRPDYSELANRIFSVASGSNVRIKNRKFMYNLVSKFRDLASGTYPLAVQVPEIFPGLTREDIEEAIRKEVEERLKDAEENQAMKRKRRKEAKALKNKRKKTEEQAEEDEGEEQLDEAEIEEEGTVEGEVLDEDVDEEIDEMNEEDLDEMDEDELDEMDEGELDEMDEESLDEEIGDDTLDDIDDAFVDEDEVEEKIQSISKTSKQQKQSLRNKIGKIARKTLPEFDIDDNWDDGSEDDEKAATPEPKPKAAKANKQQWNQTPLEGEVEIVIPNKKYKGPLKMKSPKAAKETTVAAKQTKGRKVNFTLERNKFQDHAEYQETVRRSPGVPHDPHKKPSFGVLKRAAGKSQSAKSKKLKY